VGAFASPFWGLVLSSVRRALSVVDAGRHPVLLLGVVVVPLPVWLLPWLRCGVTGLGWWSLEPGWFAEVSVGGEKF